MTRELKQTAAHKSWMRLDNAAKIYPAAMRRNWTALFRISATLSEPVDPEVLKQAQASTLKRLPSFGTRLRRGLFWYYLEELSGAPPIEHDVSNPCVRMNLRKNSGFMFRVRYYGRTIALEVFHVLSDGMGGMHFLLTLVAEYLRIKYGANIPRNDLILDCSVPPKPQEMEDAYLKYARGASLSRKEADSYRIRGTKEPDDCIHITTAMIPVDDLKTRAKAAGVTVTEYLAAAMIMAVDSIQTASGVKRKKMRPVKIGVPVNLRKFYPTSTVRNFASYINPGIDPRLGEHSFDEVLRIVHNQMALENTEKMLNAKFSTNVHTEKSFILRIVPLFIKNLAMRAVFYRVGDRKTTTSISNLGNITLPDAMSCHVERLDFILGALSQNKLVCGAVSYNDTLILNCLRTIRESDFERELCRFLIKQGVRVKVASNAGY